GVICFFYSLFHLRHRVGRRVAIWSLALVLFLFVVFYLLPSGSSRVPAKMEKHCVKHEADMLAIANQLYDLMPDSTMLEYTPKDGVTLYRIQSFNNIFGYPFSGKEDTLDASAYSHFSILNSQLLESLHCDKLTLYKPTGLALFNYLYSGFATYWFEVSLVPFTPEQVQQQLNDNYTVPFSSHVCFRFHGGATDGDAPFPYKDKYVESLRQRGILTDTISVRQ
ncbi:MAG: hypothetical protein J5641_07500, partial [Bacteroidales bacterium]|nr:hypothetical protein [Bacteroidales bacterium]